MNTPDPSIREFVYLPLARWPRLLNPFWHLLMMKHCLALYAPWVYPMFICWVVFRVFQATEFGQVFGGFAALLFLGGWFYTCIVMVSGVAWGTEARRLAAIGLVVIIVDVLILLFGSAYVVRPLVLRHINSPEAIERNVAVSAEISGFIHSSPNIRDALDKRGIYALQSVCMNCRLGWKFWWFVNYDLDVVVQKAIFGTTLGLAPGISENTPPNEVRNQLYRGNVYLWFDKKNEGRYRIPGDTIDGYPQVGYVVLYHQGQVAVYVEKGGDVSIASQEIKNVLATDITHRAIGGYQTNKYTDGSY